MAIIMLKMTLRWNIYLAGSQASSLVLMSAVETTWHLATSSDILPTIFVSVGSKVIMIELYASPRLR